MIEENKLQFLSFLMLVGIWIVYISTSPDVFLKWPIYKSLMNTIPFYLLLGLGVTWIIISNEIDLSFPFVMAVSGWIFVAVWTTTGSAILAVVCCLATGASLESLNGVIITKVGVPSIVVTIGAMFLWRGGVLLVSGGETTSISWAEGTLLHHVGAGDLGPIPMQMVWGIIATVVFWAFLNRHRIGTYILVTGDNEVAGRALGINVDRTKIITFTITGIMAAFTGILICLHVQGFFPAFGEGYLLPVLAAVFIGGTALTGGEGTIFGTLIGALIVGSLKTGIAQIGLSGFWTDAIFGILVAAATISQHTILKR